MILLAPGAEHHGTQAERAYFHADKFQAGVVHGPGVSTPAGALGIHEERITCLDACRGRFGGFVLPTMRPSGSSAMIGVCARRC